MFPTSSNCSQQCMFIISLVLGNELLDYKTQQNALICNVKGFMQIVVISVYLRNCLKLIRNDKKENNQVEFFFIMVIRSSSG